MPYISLLITYYSLLQLLSKMSMSSVCNDTEVSWGAELLGYQDLTLPDEHLNGSAHPSSHSILKARLDGGIRKKYTFAKKKVCH